jgi:hypothetical protein
MAVLVAGGVAHLTISTRALRSGEPFGAREMKLAFAIAALLRLTLLPIRPSLSEDAYRHVWDGRVQTAGFDPYLYAPADPALERLRDGEVWPRINHPELRTVYPPSAQALSLASSRVDGLLSPIGLSPIAAWKGTLLLVELAGAGLLAWGLLRAGRGAAFLIYAWSPLAVVEFYASGHVDAAGVGLLAGAVGLFLLGRPAIAGALFSAALLAKWIPAAFLGAGVRLRGKKRLLAGGTLAAALLWTPYVHPGSAPFESLGSYQANWESGGVLHRILRVDAWGALPRHLVEWDWRHLGTAGTPREKFWGRTAAAALVVVATGWAVLRGVPATAAAAVGLFAFLLVRPTVHPWYATWLLPLLALSFWRSILLWTALVPLGYEVLLRHRIEGLWRPNPWVNAAVLAVVLVAFTRELRRRPIRVPGA